METAVYRIFIVDDDQDDLELFGEAMRTVSRTTQVSLFSTGKKLKELMSALCEEQLPHLLIVDYNIPDMNGPAIIEYMKNDARLKHIPLVVWSTSDTVTHYQECIQRGAVQYFVKPYFFPEIICFVRKVLELIRHSAHHED